MLNVTKYLLSYYFSLNLTVHKIDEVRRKFGWWNNESWNAPAILDTCVLVNSSKNTKFNTTTDMATYDTNIWNRRFCEDIMHLKGVIL